MHPIALLLVLPALAQTPACTQENLNLPITLSGRPYLPKDARTTVMLTVPQCPSATEAPPEPEDILHGDNPGSDLLKGSGPANLLTNRYERQVTISPAPAQTPQHP